VTIVALMRKFIVILNTKVRDELEKEWRRVSDEMSVGKKREEKEKK
jgi:hypothetical protein